MNETETVFSWRQLALSVAKAVGLLLATTGLVFLVNVALIYVVKIAWSLYSETHIGSYFQSHFRLMTYYITYLTLRVPLDYSLKLTLFSLVAVLPIAIMMQLLHLRQWFYAHKPVYVKLIWAAALTFGVAYLFRGYEGLSSVNLAYAILLPSVLILLPLTLKVCAQYLPSLVLWVVERKNARLDA